MRHVDLKALSMEPPGDSEQAAIQARCDLVRKTAEIAACLRDPDHLWAIIAAALPGMTWAALEELTGLGRYQLQRVLARAARAGVLDHGDVPLSKAPGRWRLTLSGQFAELAAGWSKEGEA